jgi:hypothetical protein
MGKDREREEEQQAPRAEASDFEPPRLTVIGAVQELTQGKIGPDPDVVMTFVSNL